MKQALRILANRFATWVKRMANCPGHGVKFHHGNFCPFCKRKIPRGLQGKPVLR